MKKLEELLDKTKELKSQIEEIINEKNKEAKIETYALKLHVNIINNSLMILYENEGLKYFLGHINENGRCFILNTDTYIKNYDNWRKHGMKVDDSVVEWREGKYQMGTDYILERIDIDSGNIYNFKDCRVFPSCKDDNIVRFKHNNKPILF